MKIRNKLILSYVMVIFIALIIVALVFDYYVELHFERVLSSQLRRPDLDRVLQMSNPFIQAVRQSLVLAAFGSGLFAVIISYFVSNYLTSPIQKLIAATTKISKGRYDVHVRVDSGDELAELAQALNDMAIKLEEIELLRRELVANISHELATPLTSIRGYLEALDDGVVKGNQKVKTLKILRDEADRLTEMVEDVRKLAVMDDKNIILDLVETDMKMMVKKVSEKMKTQFDAKKIDLKLELENISVDADPKKMEQVLVNLLANACKYTDENGEVKVVLKEDYLVVSDNGIGIPKKDLPYVFERFYRSDHSRSRDTGGTGIGLAIVKQIVDAHCWKIVAESKVGKGSKFRIEF